MVRIGGMRIVAALIDGLILFVVLLIVHFVLAAILGIGYGGRLISGLVSAAIILAYFYTEVIKAQSPGKMAMKYTITRQDGTPASQDQLLKRYLIKMSSTLVSVVAAIVSFSLILALLVNVVGFIVAVAILVMALMMFRDSRLAYYDELCGTAVYGPGTAPQGFPVMQPPVGAAPMAPGAATPPPPPVPPTV